MPTIELETVIRSEIEQLKGPFKYIIHDRYFHKIFLSI